MEYVLIQVMMMRKVLAAMLAETAAIVTRTDHVNVIVSVDAKDSAVLTTAKVLACENGSSICVSKEKRTVS